MPNHTAVDVGLIPFYFFCSATLSNHVCLPRDESMYLVTTEMLLSRTEELSVRGRVFLRWCKDGPRKQEMGCPSSRGLTSQRQEVGEKVL